MKLVFYNLSSTPVDERPLLLSEVIKLDEGYFPTPWDKSSWNNAFQRESDYCLIYVQISNEILGFSLFSLSRPEKLAHLLKIVIHPSVRGHKIGQELLRQSKSVLIKQGLEDIFLEVETTNTSAVSLYKKEGLEVIHINKNFYGTGRNAYIMKGPIKLS